MEFGEDEKSAKMFTLMKKPGCFSDCSLACGFNCSSHEFCEICPVRVIITVSLLLSQLIAVIYLSVIIIIIIIVVGFFFFPL